MRIRAPGSGAATQQLGTIDFRTRVVPADPRDPEFRIRNGGPPRVGAHRQIKGPSGRLLNGIASSDPTSRRAADAVSVPLTRRARLNSRSILRQ